MTAADEDARRAEVAAFAGEARAELSDTLDELRWAALAIVNVAELEGAVEDGAAWGELAGDLHALWYRFAEPNAIARADLGATLAANGALRRKSGDA